MIEKGTVVYSVTGTSLTYQYVYYLVLGAFCNDKKLEKDFYNTRVDVIDMNDKVSSFMNHLCQLYVVPIGMYHKDMKKETLYTLIEYTLKNGILEIPLDKNSVSMLTLYTLKDTGITVSEKEMDLYLVKSKMLTDFSIQNSISVSDYRKKVELLVNKRFAFDINNVKKTTQYKTRHMYIYKTDKVVRLYYCAAIEENGKYLFCCAYNQNLKDGKPDIDKMKEIVADMSSTVYLDRILVKPRIIENKELLEIKGIVAPKQRCHSDYFSNVAEISRQNDVY